MVAKRRRSRSAGALNEDWLKVKCLRIHDFVIGQWLGSDKRQPSALLLGEFLGDALRYVGQIGNSSDSRLMSGALRLVNSRATSPFEGNIATTSDVHFCEPTMRASVEFLEFTEDGYLRYPTFRRLADEVFSKI
jgi:bifunctional non-homologous end joining protein LigD